MEGRAAPLTPTFRQPVRPLMKGTLTHSVAPLVVARKYLGRPAAGRIGLGFVWVGTAGPLRGFPGRDSFICTFLSASANQVRPVRF